MRKSFSIWVVLTFLLGLQLGCESLEEALGPQEPTEHAQNITANETWTAAGNPHTVTRDIAVNNATLTIEPGTVIKFDADCGITVGNSGPGAIVANGTTDAPITFTSNVSGPAAGDWDGILFRDQTMDAATVLNNCVIEYGGG